MINELKSAKQYTITVLRILLILLNLLELKLNLKVNLFLTNFKITFLYHESRMRCAKDGKLLQLGDACNSLFASNSI